MRTPIKIGGATGIRTTTPVRATARTPIKIGGATGIRTTTPVRITATARVSAPRVRVSAPRAVAAPKAVISAPKAVAVRTPAKAVVASPAKQTAPVRTANNIITGITSRMIGAQNSSKTSVQTINNQLGMAIQYDFGGALKSGLGTLGNVANTIVNPIGTGLKAVAGGLKSDDKQVATAVKSSASNSGASTQKATQKTTIPISSMSKKSKATISQISSTGAYNSDSSMAVAQKAAATSNWMYNGATYKIPSNLKEAANALIKGPTVIPKQAYQLASTSWNELDKIMRGQQSVPAYEGSLSLDQAKNAIATPEIDCIGGLCGALNGISGLVGNAAAAAAGAVNAVINVNTQAIASALAPLISAAQGAFNALKQAGADMLKAVQSIPQTLTNAVNSVWSKVESRIAGFESKITRTWERLTKIPGEVLQSVKSFINPTLEWVKSQATNALDRINKLQGQVKQWILDQVTPIWTRITQFANEIWAKVYSFAQKQYESVMAWVQAEIAKAKEWLPALLLTNFEALIAFLTTKVADYLAKAAPTPEEAAEAIIQTQKALQPYVDQYIKDFCTDPMGQGL